VSVAAVVLAGGAATRYGSDKLAADLNGTSLLEHAITGLPADADLIVVGPARKLSRPARFVREEPAGCGPAAAMIAGLRTAAISSPEAIVVLPGDAPAAGQGAVILLAALAKIETSAAAVVATDHAGRLQPLQLALRPAAAEAMIIAAGDSAGAGQSARVLLERLAVPALRIPLPAREQFDIDTPAHLAAWLEENRTPRQLRAGDA